MSTPQSPAPLRFRGSHPLIVTPMTESGALDEASLRRVVDHALAGGSTGLLALGTTGEFFSLDEDERLEVVRIVADQTRGRADVGVGAAATGSRLVVDFANKAARLGADYVLVPPPFYAPVAVNSDEGIARFFGEIAAGSGIPVMIYDGGSGIEVPLSTFEVLAAAGGAVSAVKLNMYAPRKVAPLQALGIDVFCGTDLTTLLMLRYGADGFTTAVAGVMPKACADLAERVAAGDVEGARALHYGTLLPVVNVALAALPQYVACFKHLLFLMGVIASPAVRRPLVPIDDTRASELAYVARRAGLI